MYRSKYDVSQYNMYVRVRMRYIFIFLSDEGVCLQPLFWTKLEDNKL